MADETDNEFTASSLQTQDRAANSTVQKYAALPLAHQTLFKRMDIWARTFEMTLAHGFDRAVKDADAAVKAFESQFHK